MAFDAFLKIEGIPGESSDDKHKGEIEVFSFNWGGTQAGVAAGQPARRNEKVRISDISIVKRVDKATPLLIQQASAGGVIPYATLTVVRAGELRQKFLTVTMTDVSITSMSAGGTTGSEDMPMEQISLNFNKVDVQVDAFLKF